MADLSGSNLSQASLVRAELARADLSGSNLSLANFSGADLKDAKLRNSNLVGTNLSRADLKWASFSAANLSQANLHGADLSSSDFTSADLSNAELRQANLSRANLRGANLSGANLRWADLSGADLSWADLSGARLSGANLTGANLSHANLLNAILVHVDLTRATLIGVDWAGADLSGATLTGTKLYGVLRFGIKTEGVLCDWVDLSPHGDQSNIYRLTPEDLKRFFQETSPSVQVVIDAMLNQDANYALAVAYRQIAQQRRTTFAPPNIQVGRRRTTLTFEMERDEQLFAISELAILPFGDAVAAHNNLLSIVKMLKSEEIEVRLADPERSQQLATMLSLVLAEGDRLKLPESVSNVLAKVAFLQAPTKMSLINSNNQTLTLYSHPMFGKRVIGNSELSLVGSEPAQPTPSTLPTLETLVGFIQGFYQ
jgi:uncharacterized protein YjbI with pentapeptide repeats